MPSSLAFTAGTPEGSFDPDTFVEEVEPGDEEEGIVFDDEDEGEEEGEEGEEGSVASVSDYQGDAGQEELPDRMIFELEVCRAIFSFRSDGGRFIRVCGCKAAECSREGHASVRNSSKGRAATGTYEPVRARKFTDGKLDTFLSKEEYLGEMRTMQATLRAGMFEAAAAQATKRSSDIKPASILKAPKEVPERAPPFGPVRAGPPPQAPPSLSGVGVDSAPQAHPPSGVAALPRVRSSPPIPSPPPFDVAGMMKELTCTLMDHLDHKMDQRKVEPPEYPQRLRGDQGRSKKKFYAVINGRNNTNQVFEEWIGGAQKFVTGVPGASVFKYEDYGEAWAQVERHLATQAEMELEGEELHNPPSHGGSRTRMGRSMFEAPEPELVYPPVTLLSPDASAKKDDEIFGIDLGSEIRLREKLCPPGLPRDLAKSMADGMADVIALPGGFTSGDDDNGGEMALMSSALEELVRRGRTENDCSTKSDLHWKSNSRTAMRNIKSLPYLMKRCKILSSSRDRVVKNTVRHTQNILERAGWNDTAIILAWATNGYYARIVRESIDAWIALHQHLLVLTLTEQMPWAYVQVEIDHHVEELQIIRNTHDSRLQALCGIYAYLRDGKASSWHSTALQYKRNSQVFSQVGRDDVSDVSNDLSAFHGCSHCQTTLHPGDKLSCPWKGASKNAARKKGIATLKVLAEGGVTIPPEATP